MINGKKYHKFITDISDENGDDFTIHSVINSKEKFIYVLQCVKDSLSSYPQFAIYAKEFENCM